jgi:hypothetical protein
MRVGTDRQTEERGHPTVTTTESPSAFMGAAEAPTICFFQLGLPRRSANLRGHLQRTGFSMCHVRSLATARQLLSTIVPDLLMVRVDRYAKPSDVRHEFRFLKELRALIGNETPIMVLVELPANASEQRLASTSAVVLVSANSTYKELGRLLRGLPPRSSRV